MRRWAAILAVLISAPLAWLAGEKHRENCIRLNRSECSVLLWQNGTSSTRSKLDDEIDKALGSP